MDLLFNLNKNYAFALIVTNYPTQWSQNFYIDWCFYFCSSVISSFFFKISLKIIKKNSWNWLGILLLTQFHIGLGSIVLYPTIKHDYEVNGATNCTMQFFNVFFFYLHIVVRKRYYSSKFFISNLKDSQLLICPNY